MQRIVTGVLLWAWCVSAQTATERGQELLRSGRSEEALAAYRQAVQQAPGDERALLGLAIAEYQTKRFSEAIQHATSALRINPNLHAALVFVGGSYLELGKAAMAVEPLKSAITAMPADRNATVLLAEALFSLNRYDEAEPYFTKAIQLNPADPRPWSGLGEVHEALARTASDEIRLAGPESAESYAVTGYEAFNRGHFGLAFTAFRRALEIDPKLPGVHAGLADVYRGTGHPEWADYERRAETGVQRFDLYGRYLDRVHRKRDAFERLAQLPPSLELRLHDARAFDAAGRHAEAVREWREALKLAPGNPQAELGLAWSLFRRRDYEPVIQLAETMLKRNPSSLDSNFLCGAALMNLENPDAAIPFLRRAVDGDARFLPAHAALGQALLRTGNASGAIPHLLAAVGSDEDGALHFQLARAYRLSGKTSLADATLVDYQNIRAAHEQALASEERIAITAPVREP